MVFLVDVDLVKASSLTVFAASADFIASLVMSPESAFSLSQLYL